MGKISIIVATYNAEQYLRSCMESILPQKDSQIELLIIDGGSIDSTVDIIKSFSDKIDFWKSETDEGIYDAWNKGVKIAKGDWIMFLGADDELVPGALQKYLDFIHNSNQKFDLVTSKIQMIDIDGKDIRVIGYPYQWPQFQKSMLIAHPGALHSRRLFERYGQFNMKYKIVGDYEFLLRAGAELNAAFIPEITVIMREGGASDSIRAIWESHKAAYSAGKQNRLSSFIDRFWILIKFIVKKALRKFGVNMYLQK